MVLAVTRAPWQLFTEEPITMGIRPDDPLGLRPRLKLPSPAWMAVIAGAVVLLLVVLVGADPDDRGEKLQDALSRSVLWSREIADWCRRQAPGSVLDTDEDPRTTLPRRHFSGVYVWQLQVPRRPWWQRLARPQPFSGRARLSAGDRVGASCDLQVAFTAAIEWRDVSVRKFDRYGHPYGGEARRASYVITDLRPASD
jgi:hypothetical protein